MHLNLFIWKQKRRISNLENFAPFVNEAEYYGDQ